MATFQDSVTPPTQYKTVDTTTYLLARDEDCENAFHSTADFVRHTFVHVYAHCALMLLLLLLLLLLLFLLFVDEYVVGVYGAGPQPK